MNRLTTTSFALLGQLHLRPWSAYELTRRMHGGAAGAFWSRTASRLYEEPKNLVQHGLARSSIERHGGRRRTVYSITPAGREALRAWLAEPTAPLATEFEAMIKIIFGDAGTRAQLRRNIGQVRTGILRQAESIRALAREVGDLSGEFPDRAPLAALSCRFLAELMRLQVEWADWAETFVADWSPGPPDPGMDQLARDVLKDSLRLVARLAPRATPARTVVARSPQRAPRADRIPTTRSADWAPWS